MPQIFSTGTKIRIIEYGENYKSSKSFSDLRTGFFSRIKSILHI